MSTIYTIETTATQSASALPTRGLGLGMSACAPTAQWIVDVPVRNRHLATAVVKGAFPGTSVWRPPNC